MGVESLAPQVRISPDGKWLAWRPVTEASNIWTVLALGGADAVAHLTDRAVQDWHALVAAAPLLSKWRGEIQHCIRDQPVEACSECMGLTLAINTLQNAAQL